MPTEVGTVIDGIFQMRKWGLMWLSDSSVKLSWSQDSTFGVFDQSYVFRVMLDFAFCYVTLKGSNIFLWLNLVEI